MTDKMTIYRPAAVNGFNNKYFYYYRESSTIKDNEKKKLSDIIGKNTQKPQKLILIGKLINNLNYLALKPFA